MNKEQIQFRKKNQTNMFAVCALVLHIYILWTGEGSRPKQALCTECKIGRYVDLIGQTQCTYCDGVIIQSSNWTEHERWVLALSHRILKSSGSCSLQKVCKWNDSY